jgi:hypothetical protein
METPKQRETGYVTDVPYIWRFHREIAPAWLDFTAKPMRLDAP